MQNTATQFHHIQPAHPRYGLTPWQLESLCGLLLQEYAATGNADHATARDLLVEQQDALIYVEPDTRFSREVSAILNSSN